MNLDYKGDLSEIIKSNNVCDLLPDDVIQKIGLDCKNGYDQDKASRADWETWYAEALKLALQAKEAKSFPWPNCSNIRFPLLTIAALNFHAKAYPALIDGTSVVKCRVIGTDEDGQKEERAVRVGNHMSYQLMECMPWEEQTDKGLLVTSIMGTGFKKTVRDNGRRENCSDFVMPQDVILNYYTTDLQTAPRVSHRFTLTRNALHERVSAGIYREPETKLTTPAPVDPLQAQRDRSQKLQPPQDVDVHFLIEQSCFKDLDGDGYEEPYAVTFDEQTGFVYRILARFYASSIKRKDDKKDGKIVRIEPENYWTKIPFIPSPDGGFYDVGLGILLGPITEATSTLINQITDWATMSITAGGFLGRGVRMKAGEATFRPLEWKSVDSTGDDLHKNIVPLPVKELSPVLLDLLKFLVNYGERISGSGDIQVGELPGQNVKAGTMQIANENGRLTFNAIFKRIWRAHKEEFKKLYRLNRLYQEDEEFTYAEVNFKIKREDYAKDESGIIPSADPNIVSKTERRQRADMLSQRAMSVPGYNKPMVEKMWLEAYEIPGSAALYDPEKFKPQPHPKLLEAQAKLTTAQANQMKVKGNLLVAIQKLQMDAKVSQAKILELQAKAAMELKQAEGVDKGHAIALLDAMIGAEEKKRDDVLQLAGMLMDSMKESDGQGDVSGVASGPGNAGVLQPPMESQAAGAGGLGA